MTFRRFLAPIGALTLLGIVGGATYALVSGGDREPTRAAPALDAAAKEARLSPEAAALLDLLEKGGSATFHARYVAVSEDSPGMEMSMTLWRRPPLGRQDTEVSSAGQSARTAAFRIPTGVVVCVQELDKPWACRRAGAEPTGPEALIAQVTEQLKERRVAAKDETIAGQRARCFTLLGTGESSQMCVTAKGIPVRVTGGPARLELRDLSYEVPEEVFEPPASAQ